jgi:hypothetical protein
MTGYYDSYEAVFDAVKSALETKIRLKQLFR